jgi:hypothetical protein
MLGHQGFAERWGKLLHTSFQTSTKPSEPK